MDDRRTHAEGWGEMEEVKRGKAEGAFVYAFGLLSLFGTDFLPATVLILIAYLLYHNLPWNTPADTANFPVGPVIWEI